MSGQQFNPPGLILFRIPFNVDSATAAGFIRFIQDVERRLCSRIQRPRLYGTGTTVLPCPQAGRRTWFVIELESRDREMTYSVPVFIEAETIYLRGYQNQRGDLFEFARDNAGDNLPPPEPYLGRASTSLSFGCNYEDLVARSQQTSRGGGGDSASDPGLVLQPPPPEPEKPAPQQGSSKQQKKGEEDKRKKEPRSPNFGQERLKDAVRELADGQNLRGQSQHRTAQNLLLVIVRFCESIRFRSIRDEMAALWTVHRGTGQPSRCLSLNCFGQIKNWNKLAIPLQDSARSLVVWPRELARVTGVSSAAQAQAILVVVLFREYENEPGNPIPEWDRNPPPDDDTNNRRRHGGPGGGAAGGVGVHAAELPVPRRLPVPQEPVMEILGVYVVVPRHPGLQGVYGTITVDDGLGAQAIFRRSRVNYQRYSSQDSETMTLELNILDRSVSAADSWDIVVDLWSASTDARLSTGRLTWSICDFSSNTYDSVMHKTIGQAVVKYVVYSRAMEDAAVVDTQDDITFELGPGTGSSMDFGYAMVDNVTSDTSSSAGRHDDL